ncbi:MAG: AAA family ATPase [Candidatus Sumerlaeia bacterium]
MADVIAFANQKGGVGKTTSAINVAACLAEKNRKTLLIDCDPQGNASSGVGLPPSERSPNLYDVMSGECALRDACRPTAWPNLWALPSSIDLIAGEIEFQDDPRKFHLLADALNGRTTGFDFIVLDAPPSLGLLALNVLVAATDLIVPVQAEYYALEGLTLLSETLRRVRSSMNPRLNLLGILLTMIDRRTNLCRQVEDEVRAHFGGKVFQVVINRSVRLGEAPSHGQPIIAYEPEGRSSQDYRFLVEEILRIKRFAQPTGAPPVQPVGTDPPAPAKLEPPQGLNF